MTDMLYVCESACHREGARQVTSCREGAPKIDLPSYLHNISTEYCWHCMGNMLSECAKLELCALGVPNSFSPLIIGMSEIHHTALMQ